MNCSNYQNLISSHLDGELDPGTWEAVEEHLSRCEECNRVFSDLDSILDFCDDSFALDVEPPNSHALWCRINNVIESEVPADQTVETVPTRSRGGVWNTGFRLSFGQVASAIAGIALVSSLLTLVVLRNVSVSSDTVAKGGSTVTVVDKVLADLGLGETAFEQNERRLKEQKEAIAYWKARVEARRASWNDETRIVFDRNLGEIDKAVNEYTRLLRDNPQDSISNEMLDAALKEKVELLREFSEL